MRPYRHIPTADLEARRDFLFRDIEVNIKYGYTMLNGAARRELRRVSRELDRRAKESK